MKFVKTVALAIAILFVADASASAQGPAPANIDEVSRVESAKVPKGSFPDTRALGAGLVILGAALGIGGLTKSAVESMARQPEMADKVQTAMIISAALIEGVAFFALIIIMLFLTPY